MRQITYISTAVDTLDAAAFRSIEAAAQRRNARDGLCGLLLFDGHRFLQVLEGPAAPVEAAIERIQADPRHFGLVRLKDCEIDAPHFGGWAMLCKTLQDDTRDIVDLVGPMMRDADRSTRALFESFAAIRSKAA